MRILKKKASKSGSGGLDECQNLLGVQFQDSSLLLEAITHKSYVNENNRLIGNNQRLEFLGDSVLSLVITEYLYNTFIDSDEGTLSRFKASLISEHVLSEMAISFKLGEYLKLGCGEEQNGGRFRSSMLCDVFEAVVGAIYLDGGFIAARAFILNAFEDKFKEIDLNNFNKDYKTIFQEMVQKHLKITPTYNTRLVESAKNASRIFHSEALVNGEPYAKGKGDNKKDAERAAAKKAIVVFKKHYDIN